MSDNSENNNENEISGADGGENDEVRDEFSDSAGDDFSPETREFSEYLAGAGDITTYNKNAELEQIEEKSSNALRSTTGKMKKPVIIAAAIIFAAAAGLYIGGMASLPKDKVMNNVYIADIDLSGMTYDEALDAIAREYMMNDTAITVTCNDQTFTITGSDIGMAANAEDTAKRAFNYGKSGNIMTDGFRNAVCMLKRHEIMPAANIDRELLISKINEFGVSLYGEMQNHTVQINEADTTADIYPGHTGYNPNAPESYTDAADAILNSINDDRYTDIAISLSAVPPPDLLIDQLDAAVYADPVNAEYVIDGNSVSVTPESNGRYINKDEAAEYLKNVYEGGEIVKVPYYVSYAEVTEASLTEKLFADSLASYSTNFGGSTANRAANVRRAAELINGTVIEPGGIFSFNDTVGDRSASNGFYEATEYVNGESVMGIGGGTCQVSTTLYSAVLYADLQIVHRESHAMTVGYVPLGQDATVAYGSVDFKFKNSTDYPIKISCYTEGATIYASIIGTPWEPARSVEIKHSVSNSGDNTIVDSTRYVYENGELLSSDYLGQSYYKPHKSQTT